MNGSMVEVRGLGKRYPGRSRWFGDPAPGVEALTGVSFDVGEGEIFGLVGRNGAGKTTLLKLLSTLLVPDAGSARVSGFDVVSQGAEVRRRLGLVTSDERSFYWRLSGRQNLEFFASLYGLPRREACHWSAELLERVGLEAVADRRFEGYSTGMRQRLALARGLLSRPRLLLLDEPTKGVDTEARQQLLLLLEQELHAEERRTMLVTSHDLGEVEALCERIAVLHSGRLLAVGTLEQLQTAQATRARYDLRVRGLAPEALSASVAATGAEVLRLEGSSPVHLSVLTPDGEVLARCLRRLVEQGGDLLDCSRHETSLEHVVRQLVARAEETSP